LGPNNDTFGEFWKMHMSIDRDRIDQSPPAVGRDAALFLDADGTLLEIAQTPSAVHGDEATRNLLENLQGMLSDAVAVVSGRPIADIDRIFRIPSLSIAGLHGLEWRDATGTVRRPVDLPPVGPLKDRIESFAASCKGMLVEDKGATIAVHYRHVPEAGARTYAFLADLIRDCEGLTLLHGKMVVEVKPSGIDKGRAIERFMAAAPFAGRRPVFAGDDVTDELGFVMVNGLDGLSVRIGNSDTNVETAARYRLPDVSALHRWLRDSVVSADRKIWRRRR
jgi:trehalose 6-phosphate phosphatase